MNETQTQLMCIFDFEVKCFVRLNNQTGDHCATKNCFYGFSIRADFLEKEYFNLRMCVFLGFQSAISLSQM